MRGALLSSIIFGLAASLAACEAIIGLDDHRFRIYEPPPPPPDPCVRRRSPGRPDVPDDATGDPYTYVLAIRRVDPRGRNPDGTLVGYDLDNSCTCSGLPNTANDGGHSCAPSVDPSSQCDAVGGVDNALALLGDAIPQLRSDPRFGDLGCGKESILLLLNDYSGKANDPAVTLQIVETTGIRDEPTDFDAAVRDACNPDSDRPTFPAKFDGNDVWVTPGVLNPRSSGSNFATARGPAMTGWVRNYTLVVENTSDDQVPLIVFGRYVKVSRPRFEAKLVPLDEAGNPLALGANDELPAGGRPPHFAVEDGTIAGRVLATDVLNATARVRFGQQGKYVCNDPAAASFAKAVICSAADLNISPLEDFQQAPCNAISVGLKVEARTARIGRDDDVRVDLDPLCDPIVDFAKCD